MNNWHEETFDEFWAREYCPCCHGQGIVPDDDDGIFREVECPECGGDGQRRAALVIYGHFSNRGPKRGASHILDAEATAHGLYLPICGYRPMGAGTWWVGDEPPTEVCKRCERRERPELSERVLEVYGAIVAHKEAHDGNSPSLRELCELTGYASTNTVSWALNKLAEAGMIVLGPRGQTRSIEVVGARWLGPDEARDLLVSLRMMARHPKVQLCSMTLDGIHGEAT